MTELPPPLDWQAILALRREVRFQDGRPYEARCSKVAKALQSQFGWKREWGCLRLLDSRVCWQRCWNRLADGRLLDATADQFESRWLGDLVVLEADSPYARAYQQAPPGWTFTLRERAAGIDIDAVRDGASEHGATISSANWMDAAEQVFLPDDLVDYAARVLRVRALLRQSITSADLDGLMTMYEIAHAVAARGGPWMSPEYAAILD